MAVSRRFFLKAVGGAGAALAFGPIPEAIAGDGLPEQQDRLAIIVHEGDRKTFGDVVDALKEKHEGNKVVKVIPFSNELKEVQGPLATFDPTHMNFVATPRNAGPGVLSAVHAVSRSITLGTLVDAPWGLITGRTVEAALKLVETPKDGMTLDHFLTKVMGDDDRPILNYADRGIAFDERNPTIYATKESGKPLVFRRDGAQDDTADFVAVLNGRDSAIDLTFTVGGSDSVVWQMGYKLPEGALIGIKGQVYGLDKGQYAELGKILKDNGGKISEVSDEVIATWAKITNDKPHVFFAAGSSNIGAIRHPDHNLALAMIENGGAKMVYGATGKLTNNGVFMNHVGWDSLPYLFGTTADGNHLTVADAVYAGINSGAFIIAGNRDHFPKPGESAGDTAKRIRALKSHLRRVALIGDVTLDARLGGKGSNPVDCRAKVAVADYNAKTGMVDLRLTATLGAEATAATYGMPFVFTFPGNARMTDVKVVEQSKNLGQVAVAGNVAVAQYKSGEDPAGTSYDLLVRGKLRQPGKLRKF